MSANVTSIETARAKMVYAALVAAGFLGPRMQPDTRPPSSRDDG